MTVKNAEDAKNTEPPAPPDADAAQPEPQPPADVLGDAGKRALAAERAARKAAEKAAADAAKKVAEFEDRDKTELQKATDAAEQARREADAAKQEVLRLRIASEYQIPPDLADLLVGGDEEQLRDKAQRLQAATARQTAPRAPAPDPAQGAKPGSTGPDQLSRADLAQLDHNSIAKALAEGRLADVLSGRNK